ncbi:LuxR C-terminal-related transcriptional regulator [Paraconexibacter antarcticus]|uniref:LuxR C-terminal-related transcriptional regulator n=1 Tax=Paraconexibacter antarcticus TaxID=2949664 RepID=A0ABY5DQT4_9ACTN|nr:LuxR C-terminal-related transcriptional regulator [Paraconexibacter antarcticus]UTI63598.1 LuxR C-terminal-related transcriptional regulator [Paraconexibacter antarcticus]
MAISVPPTSPPSPSEPPADAAAAATERDRLSAALRSGSSRSASALATRIRALDHATARLRGDHAETPDDARMQTLVAINESIGRLQALGSTAAVIEAAPEELCRSCGFSRAMLSRVHGSVWVPEVLYTAPEAPDMPEFRDYVDVVEIPLEHMLLETDLVRRRIPVYVKDPQNDNRTFREIIQIADVRSYAAAPIMPTRRVIGFLHADRRGQDRPVGPEDRDSMWAFAEHFGLLFERMILVERLERQRQEINATLMRAADAVNALCEEELELARHEHPAEARGHAHPSSRPSALSSLLSAREREVLELVASGATNTVVAEQLVISQGTVKSHVKRILRKLHVANRAEAVARYLQLLRLEEGPR